METVAEVDAYIATVRADPQWQREKAEFDAWSDALEPIIAGLAARAEWWLLEFTPEAMEIQCGDPDIAFQCEIDGWVLRADYIGECGPGSARWRPDEAHRAAEEFEFFAHGTPVRPATPEEIEEYGGWLFRDAFLSYVADLILPPPRSC